MIIQTLPLLYCLSATSSVNYRVQMLDSQQILLCKASARIASYNVAKLDKRDTSVGERFYIIVILVRENIF